MPDEDKDKKPAPGSDDHDKDKKDDADKDKKDSDKKDEDRVPQGKLDQAWKDKKAVEERAEAAEKKLREREEEEQRKKGEFEKLADDYKLKHEKTSEELEALKKAREEDEAVFGSILEKELEAIPEDRRSLIPEDYNIRQKLKYISSNREALTAKAGGKPGEKGQPGSDNKKKPDDELGAVEAERDELFKKNREQRGLDAADQKRMMELTRKIVELKESQKS